MTSALDTTTRSRRPGRVASRWLLVVLALGAWALIAQATAGRGEQSAGQAAQRAGKDVSRTGSRLTFRITQATKSASKSEDQITILFSDRPWLGTAAPYPLFGEDVLQEFSFSAIDLDAQRPLTFTRVVMDPSFLDARFIRVVNHGSEVWDGGTLSITLGRRVILDKVALQPRQGDPAKGLQDWNRKKWGNRTYWEAELQQIRRP